MITTLKFVVLVLLFSDGTSRLTPMPARECVAVAALVARGDVSRAVSIDGLGWRRIIGATCAPQSNLTPRERAVFSGE